MDSTSVSHKGHFAKGMQMGFMNLFTNMSLMAVLHTGGQIMAEGKMSAGDLARFAIQSGFGMTHCSFTNTSLTSNIGLLYCVSLVGLGFAGLSTFYSDMKHCLKSAERIFTYIDAVDVETTSVGHKQVRSVPVFAENCEIKFVNVSFAYAGRKDVCVLNNLSLTISSKAITAIAGEPPDYVHEIISTYYCSTCIHAVCPLSMVCLLGRCVVKYCTLLMLSDRRRFHKASE